MKLVQETGLFFNYRFRAHHLPMEELEVYLCGKDSVDCSLSEVIDRLLAEPFFILNKEYLESLALYLFYGEGSSDTIDIDEGIRKSNIDVIKQLHKIVGPYTIIEHKKEEEMF